MIRLAVLLFTASATVPAFAWNALGHKVVAEIAWRELDPPSRQQIVDILRRHPRFDADFASKMTDEVLRGDKETQDHWIFQHTGTWPDLARNLPKGERGKYDRPKWHYVDFPLYLDNSDRRALAGKLTVNLSNQYPIRIDEKDYNVMQAIRHCQAALSNRNSAPDTKALAYCWLFHLVGDLHQPLHSTSLFCVNHFPDGEGDRGGNEIPLARGKNLHSLWDNLLGRQHYMRDVTKAVVELSNRERFGDVWESAARETDPRKWANESHELCETFVYDATILNAVRTTPAGTEIAKIELPDAYYKEAGEHARRRIIAAGLRLAAVLKQLEGRLESR